eukprot:GHUV01034038.1.p2 GENE.GHUV01034038.1~~GHUV01034038.1.p2  ORF type:complete len:132 (-),score=13.45 GHUV01034038.1:7-402(-)
MKQQQVANKYYNSTTAIDNACPTKCVDSVRCMAPIDMMTSYQSTVSSGLYQRTRECNILALVDCNCHSSRRVGTLICCAGSFAFEFVGESFINAYHNISNIILHISRRGQEQQPAVMLVAHHDSPVGSPGE